MVTISGIGLLYKSFRNHVGIYNMMDHIMPGTFLYVYMHTLKETFRVTNFHLSFLLVFNASYSSLYFLHFLVLIFIR